MAIASGIRKAAKKAVSRVTKTKAYKKTASAAKKASTSARGAAGKVTSTKAYKKTASHVKKHSRKYAAGAGVAGGIAAGRASKRRRR